MLIQYTYYNLELEHGIQDLMPAVLDTSACDQANASRGHMSKPTPPPATPRLPICNPTSTSASSIPESACLTCGRDLSGASDIDALHHRTVCFYNGPNKSCPVCKCKLASSINDLQGSLLHLQRCQKGSKSYSFIEADDFEALYMVLCGRREITYRFFQRTGRVRVQRRSKEFDRKMMKKRGHVDFVYKCGESTLRNCVNGDGEEVEGWRTAGDIGKAARNMFPIVHEDFDPSILFEGLPQQLPHSNTPPHQSLHLTVKMRSWNPMEHALTTTYRTQSEKAQSDKAQPDKTQPDINLHGGTHADTPRDVETPDAPGAQPDEAQDSNFGIALPSPELEPSHTCLFCAADSQGSHKRFEKMSKKMRKLLHWDGSHPHVDSSPTSQLPSIVLSTPDTLHKGHMDYLLEFDPKRLFPAPKRRGRAHWVQYKWLPNIAALKEERRMQTVKETQRLRKLKLRGKRMGAVRAAAWSATLMTVPLAQQLPIHPRRFGGRQVGPIPGVAEAISAAGTSAFSSPTDPAESGTGFNATWASAIASQMSVGAYTDLAQGGLDAWAGLPQSLRAQMVDEEVAKMAEGIEDTTTPLPPRTTKATSTHRQGAETTQSVKKTAKKPFTPLGGKTKPPVKVQEPGASPEPGSQEAETLTSSTSSKPFQNTVDPIRKTVDSVQKTVNPPPKTADPVQKTITPEDTERKQKPRTPYPVTPKACSCPVTFTSRRARRTLKIIFGQQQQSNGKAPAHGGDNGDNNRTTDLDIPNGSVAHRPDPSTSVRNLSFTVPSELHDEGEGDDHDPVSPVSRPGSLAWPVASLASSDSSRCSAWEMSLC